MNNMSAVWLPEQAGVPGMRPFLALAPARGAYRAFSRRSCARSRDRSARRASYRLYGSFPNVRVFIAQLRGDPADDLDIELLGERFRHLDSNMLLGGRPGTVRRDRWLKDLAGPGLPSGEGGVSTALVRERFGFVPSWISWFAEAAAHSRVLWSSSFLAEFAKRDPYRGLLDALDIKGQIKDREIVHQSLYLWTKSMFANLLLNQLGDRMEMSHAVEGRVPFLDGPVVELLRDMPVSMKIRGAHGKHVLREVAKPLVTETVLRRRKRAFLAPPPSLQPNGRLHQMLQDLVRSEIIASVPFFDRCAVVRFLDGLPGLGQRRPESMVGLGNQLVYLASACVLQARYQPAA